MLRKFAHLCVFPIRSLLRSPAHRLRSFLLAPLLIELRSHIVADNARHAHTQRCLEEIDMSIVTSVMEQRYPPKWKITSGLNSFAATQDKG